MDICDSQAKQRNLKAQFSINAIGLSDKSVRKRFKCLKDKEKEVLYKKYADSLGSLMKNEANSQQHQKQSKLIAMISSIKVTFNEDCDMLLNCIMQTESQPTNVNQVTKVPLVIIEENPMKDKFRLKVQEAKGKLKVFDVRSIWIDIDDFSQFLGSVDLGVSLHWSSSGIDLPMKVVDMFSPCILTAAVYYPTITELVKEEDNCQVKKIDENRMNVQKSLNVNKWIKQWYNTIKPINAIDCLSYCHSNLI